MFLQSDIGIIMKMNTVTLYLSFHFLMHYISDAYENEYNCSITFHFLMHMKMNAIALFTFHFLMHMKMNAIVLFTFHFLLNMI